MIVEAAKLVDDLFDEEKLEMKPTRDGFGTGLVEAGEKDERIVALCADLTESTRVEWFKEKFPERFVEIGVAEQNLASVAAGMAHGGKIPFIASYATFSPGRNNEQIRTLVAISKRPVKIVGAHAGVSVGPDGATHQALEDIALMRTLPNMTVVAPCDAVEAHKATLAIATNNEPSYIRLGREKSAVFTTQQSPFELGKATVLKEGKDAVIVACGILVYEALKASKTLADDGIEVAVINNHTIKPMDEKTIVEYAQKCGAVVTAEEHQAAGGMGSAVAELLAQQAPVPIEFIGIKDKFGESGSAKELIKLFKLDAESIVKATKLVIKRKIA